MLVQARLPFPQIQAAESTRTWWVSARPISTGPPACLMEDTGEAPVPPSWPLIWITSALALATPLATVPIPAWATSFTLTLAEGAICRRSVSQHSSTQCSAVQTQTWHLLRGWQHSHQMEWELRLQVRVQVREAAASSLHA